MPYAFQSLGLIYFSPLNLLIGKNFRAWLVHTRARGNQQIKQKYHSEFLLQPFQLTLFKWLVICSLVAIHSFCSATFVLAVAMYPSAENQVCLEQLGEEVSESWVSLSFSLSTHQTIREEHWFVEHHELKCSSCPDHILGCWKIATAAMTSITRLDWVLPLKNKRSGRVWGTPEKILLA